MNVGQKGALVLGHEGVGDALHAVHGTDEGDGGAPADDQAEVPRVLGQLVGIVRVTEVLDGVVQHDVEERIKPLQSSTGLAAPGKLDSDLLVDKPEEDADSVLPKRSAKSAFGPHADRFQYFSPHLVCIAIKKSGFLEHSSVFVEKILLFNIN